MKISNFKKNGFTLVEILLVLALVSILLSIIIVAINPSKQLADSRDAQRASDMYSIAQAVYHYAADNEGDFPDTITIQDQEICKTDTESCAGLSDLSALTDSETYLIFSPVDPLCGSVPGVCAENGTGYFVSVTEGGRLTIKASSSENTVITVTQ